MSGKSGYSNHIGPHDVGGLLNPYLDNFGKLDLKEKPLQYWEYLLHGLVFALCIHQPPLVTVDEMRRAIESLDPEQYNTWGYYDRWAAALATNLLERGVIAEQELDGALYGDEWKEHGVLHQETGEFVSYPTKYQVGDYIRVKREDTRLRWRRPHLRVPGYIFGLIGKIISFNGIFDDPFLLAFRGKGPKQPLYTVAFPMKWIWTIPQEAQGEGRGERDIQFSEAAFSDSEDHVIAEIYQEWLEPYKPDYSHEKVRRESRGYDDCNEHSHQKDEKGSCDQHEHDHSHTHDSKEEQHKEHSHHHDHDHDQSEIFEVQTAYGTLVLSVFEEGILPEFRIRFKDDWKEQQSRNLLLLSDQIIVKTIRSDGETQTFHFEPLLSDKPSNASGLVLHSEESIPEPHEFTAEIELSLGDGEPLKYSIEFKEPVIASEEGGDCDHKSHDRQDHHQHHFPEGHSHDHENECHDDQHRHQHDHSHEKREIVEKNANEKEGENNNTPGQIIATALMKLCIDKQLTNSAMINKFIEILENLGKRLLGADLVAHAWKNPEFKAKLLLDSKKAGEEVGINVGSTTIRVVENTKEIHNVIVCTLCSCYPATLLGLPPSWYKSRNYRARIVREPRKVLQEFGVDLPTTTRIIVRDSTADLRYLVIPLPPKSLSAEDIVNMSIEELRTYASRDSMVGVSLL